ncbi:MAG: hypothetical protein AAB796_02840, partial [Patescibacteria group bacterium]
LLSTTTAATFNVTDNATLGDAITDVLTLNAGTIYLNNSSTSTIPNMRNNAYSISTSSATSTNGVPIITISTLSSQGGLVGIGGTSSPSQALSVQGNILGSGTLTTTGSGINSLMGTLTVSGTTTLNAAIVFGSLTGDPGTATNGTIYYSTADNAFRSYTNNTWGILAGGGFSKDSITRLITLTSLGDRVSIGTTSPAGMSQVTIEATTTTSIPLSLRATSSQSANLFQILTASNAQLLTVNAQGFLGLGTNTPSTLLSVQGNILVSGNISSANITATGTITTPVILVNGSTSTITNLVTVNATSTNATTTYLAVTNTASISQLTVSNNTSIGGTLSLTGLATLTGGILVNNGTSTITNLVTVNATSTNATTTYLSVGTLASTSQLTVSNNTSIGGTLSLTGLSTLTGGILVNNATSTITNL